MDVTDRLAEALPEPSGPAPGELGWGLHAAAFPPDYWHWLHLQNLRGHEQTAERKGPELPNRGPLLSVVVPVYRPSLWYFRACVRSVISQTYEDWELCLCDDGSGDPDLTEAMEEFAAADQRVEVVALEHNGGISRATNRALEESHGDFVVLLDNDDVLDPEALAEIAAATDANQDADVVYSDEDKLDELDRRFMPHFKPDWDPDLLLAYPYMGHVMAIRRELFSGSVVSVRSSTGARTTT